MKQEEQTITQGQTIQPLIKDEDDTLSRDAKIEDEKINIQSMQDLLIEYKKEKVVHIENEYVD